MNQGFPAVLCTIIYSSICSGLCSILCSVLPFPAAHGGEPEGRLRVKVSWGHERPEKAACWVRLAGYGVQVLDPRPVDFEPGDAVSGGGGDTGAFKTQAGAGDVDGIDFTLVFTLRQVAPIEKPHSIWSYLLEHSDPGTARRLRQDPGMRPDPRRLSVLLDREGTRGFSLTVDQLERLRAFWVADLDIFVAAGDPPVSFDEHRRELQPLAGRRILDQVRSGPEASYEQFKSLWEDMGSPAYRNPHQAGPGHIICLAWEGSIHKFGIDRGAGVWNDYGNPDRFRFWLDAGDLSGDLTRAWKGQRLSGGLPVVTTCLERDGVRYEIEQFAYPLNGPPPERRGDIPMTLCQKLTLTELEGRSRTLRIGMTHQRDLAGGEGAAQPGKAAIEHVVSADTLVWEEVPSRRALLVVQGKGISVASESVQGSKPKTVAVAISLDMVSRETRELTIKIPSPPVEPADREKLLALDHASAREGTLRFWKDWLSRGALLDVPEEAVNDLFRANLWHALRLPRRHGGPGETTRIDLPYSNFAYDQTGTPWPVNQAVYVDSMLHDLRGYHELSAEEISAMYRGNQEADGRLKGVASWGVYTPGMVYATARHYLLSGDRESFEKLLGPTLRALDWCLAQMRRASERAQSAQGLILAPLNDLSHEERAWAFNQSYYFAGADLLARALSEIGHPRAAECADAARAMFRAIEREFGRASAAAPLVQLRDGTWIPYVPSDALAPRRLLEIWYPTDVDTGPLHLSRLGALDPEGQLTTCILEDHEDNLFLGGLGMANEPVYNPQATAYLLRDDVKPAIRAFYSMMACAFSHSALEPVEHRWAWGQYFGPPSTDGAWFELYRHMLIREREDGSLLLLQAAPRKWLEDGKRIRVERAPTYHGTITFSVESHAAAGEIAAVVDVPRRKRPASLLVRLRHPAGQPMRAATVNGEPWKDFDAKKEWIRIADPVLDRYAIVARY